MFIMAIVMMNAGTLKLATIKPLIKPAAVPTRSPATMATPRGSPWLTMNPTVRVPDMATIDPTDKSMCPSIIISVIPSAMYVLIDICLSTDMMLLVVRNLSVASATATHMIIRTTMIPMLPLTMDVRGLFFNIEVAFEFFFVSPILFDTSCSVFHYLFL